MAFGEFFGRGDTEADERADSLVTDNLQLSTSLAAATERATEAERTVELLKVALSNVPDFLAKIQEIYDDGNIPEAAVAQAICEILEAERTVHTERLIEELKRLRDATTRAKFRAEEGPIIYVELDARFRSDGTYALIDELVADEERERIADELKESEKDRIREELASPEQRQRIIAELMAELLESGELDTYRADVAHDKQEVWREEAAELGKDQIRAEVEVGKDAYIATAKAAYLGSYKGRERRARIVKELEEKWNPESLENVAEELHDEVLLGLLHKLAEQARIKLERETQAAQLLDSFTHAGIETDEIQTDSVVVISLGTIRQTTTDVDDPNSYYRSTKKIPIQEMVCRRMLKLLALGSGRFMVVHDSLNDVADTNNLKAFIQDSIIKDGTVIVIGRRVTENGTASLVRRVAVGVELFYDDDTSTPHFETTNDDVVNIGVNGVSAVDYDSVVGLDGKKTKKADIQ